MQSYVYCSSVLHAIYNFKYCRCNACMEQISEVEGKPFTSSLNIFPEAMQSRGVGGGGQWLNMELDLQSLFGFLVRNCAHWLRPRNSPPPLAFGLVYEDAIGQPRWTTSLYNPWVGVGRSDAPHSQPP